MDETKPQLNGGRRLPGSRLFARVMDLAGRHRLLASLVVHNAVFALALLLAFLIRFDVAGESPGWLRLYLLWLPFFLVVKTIIFGQLKLLRSSWQYAGIRDLVNILIASWVFLMIVYVIYLLFTYMPTLFYRSPLFSFSRGVPLLDFLATVFLISTARLGVRLYREELRPVSSEGLRRVLIVGAGNTAEALLREIFRMREDRYRVIGLVDDDPHKTGTLIHSIPVLGTTDDIKRICEENKVEEVLIAVPSATQKQLRAIIEKCQGAKLRIQSLPGMDALIDGRVTVSQIRSVEIKDLLGREAIKLDTEDIAHFIADRAVLITGAGGSIGSEMCRQVCVFKPARLILLEQAENGLFDIGNELRRSFPAIPVAEVICDIVDRDRVTSVFKIHRPDVVIHAAAHKHVPLMELNPCEAVKNNIFGTKNVADACCATGVKEFVMISTDKAVNPSSIMGCTKRVAEIYTQSLNGSNGCITNFKAVRFGNVLGSAGSVVPTFERQIRQGGPITITHPDMTRYFMTIPEASQLVLQAAATGQGGQIFLLDMGEPVKIVDLARDMITLSGLRVGEDIDIVFTGCRPGEKLFEELRTAGEDMEPTVHPKVKVWKHRKVEWDKIQEALAEFSRLATCTDRDRIVAALQLLVPEYAPMNPPKPQA